MFTENGKIFHFIKIGVCGNFISNFSNVSFYIGIGMYNLYTIQSYRSEIYRRFTVYNGVMKLKIWM